RGVVIVGKFYIRLLTAEPTTQVVNVGRFIVMCMLWLQLPGCQRCRETHGTFKHAWITNRFAVTQVEPAIFRGKERSREVRHPALVPAMLCRGINLLVDQVSFTVDVTWRAVI